MFLAAAVLAAAGGLVTPAPATASGLAATPMPNVVVPAPVSAVADGTTLTLTSAATIATAVTGIGDYLAQTMRASTGYALPVTTGGTGTITLTLSGAPASVGTQGYQLTVTTAGATVSANAAAGLFAGVQTLLQ